VSSFVVLSLSHISTIMSTCFFEKNTKSNLWKMHGNFPVVFLSQKGDKGEQLGESNGEKRTEGTCQEDSSSDEV
jgi:hypothetical protein